MSRGVPVTVTTRHGRRRASSGASFEPVMGYARAVRTGAVIAVSGTVGMNADGSYPTGIGAQTRRALTIIRTALAALGGRPEDVIRTRMFVTDVSRWRDVAEIHGEMFADIRPATTIVEVTRLIDPEALIEIEADAIVPSRRRRPRSRARRGRRPRSAAAS